MSDRPTVLYACIHNSGRSVAAQVLTRHYARDAVDVRSAGSEPGLGVNPVVAEVLAERGLPVTDHVPTELDYDLVETADIVITMGCGETCPVFPGKRYEDWGIDDPAGQDLPTVRAIVDDIDVRVRRLLAELATARPCPGSPPGNEVALGRRTPRAPHPSSGAGLGPVDGLSRPPSR